MSKPVYCIKEEVDGSGRTIHSIYSVRGNAREFKSYALSNDEAVKYIEGTLQGRVVNPDAKSGTPVGETLKAEFNRTSAEMFQ